VRPLFDAARASYVGEIIVREKVNNRVEVQGEGGEEGNGEVAAQLRMGVCHVCVGRGLCLVATTGLLKESAVSRYLGEFGKMLA
jgi:hypothetical protein